jgi:hypothetical protein
MSNVMTFVKLFLFAAVIAPWAATGWAASSDAALESRIARKVVSDHRNAAKPMSKPNSSPAKSAAATVSPGTAVTKISKTEQKKKIEVIKAKPKVPPRPIPTHH